MKIILKIGGYAFALRGRPNINSLITMLQEAIPVRPEFKEGEYFYRPETEHVANVEIEFVGDDKVRSSANGHSRPTATVIVEPLAVARRTPSVP